MYAGRGREGRVRGAAAHTNHRNQRPAVLTAPHMERNGRAPGRSCPLRLCPVPHPCKMFALLGVVPCGSDGVAEPHKDKYLGPSCPSSVGQLCGGRDGPPTGHKVCGQNRSRRPFLRARRPRGHFRPHPCFSAANAFCPHPSQLRLLLTRSFMGSLWGHLTEGASPHRPPSPRTCQVNT